MANASLFFKENRFSIISWAVTIALIGGMLGGAFMWKNKSTANALDPIATAQPNQNSPKVALPALGGPIAFQAIGRQIQIKTNVPADKPRYKVTEYRVVRGDSIFAIAESYKLKPE